MRYGNFVTTALQHSFHPDARVVMIIHQQDASMLCDCQFSFRSHRLIFSLAVGAGRRDYGVQFQRKDGALILAGAFDANFSAMRVDQRFRDRESEAEPSKTSRDLGLSLFECIKDFIDLFGLDADARVDDPDLNFVRRGVERFDSDSPFFRREFHAVFDQIPKDLLQSCGIAFQVGLSGAKMKVRFEILGSDFLATYFISALQELMDANRFKA